MDRNVIRERLEKLREKMADEGITAYYINSSDFHNSEYIGDYFKVREFFSGFTGSNGTLIVTADEAGLWTDGRYFVQAEKELDGTGITLYKSGEKDVITTSDYLAVKLGEGNTLGFDGRTVTAGRGKKFKALAKKKGFGIKQK